VTLKCQVTCKDNFKGTIMRNNCSIPSTNLRTSHASNDNEKELYKCKSLQCSCPSIPVVIEQLRTSFLRPSDNEMYHMHCAGVGGGYTVMVRTIFELTVSCTSNAIPFPLKNSRTSRRICLILTPVPNTTSSVM